MNKIYYLPKFTPGGKTEEYFGGNLKESEVSSSLSRDQWNDLYKQGRVSLTQIPRKYQSWIEAENSSFKQDVTDAINNFGTKYVAPTLATAFSFNPIIGGAINAAQTGVNLAIGNWLGVRSSILPGIGKKLSKPISKTLKSFKYKTNVYNLPKSYHITISERKFLKKPIIIGELSLEPTSSNTLNITNVTNAAQNRYKRMSEELYNAGIRLAKSKGYEGIVSGKTLMDPKRTIKITNKYQKKLINHSGSWHGKEPEWQGNNKPVYLLQEPTIGQYEALRPKTNKDLSLAIKNNTYLTKRIDQNTLDRLEITDISPKSLRSKIEDIPIEFGNATRKGGAYYDPIENRIIVDYDAPKSMYGEMIDHERLHAFDVLTKNSSNRYSGDVSIVLGARPLYQKELGNTGIFTSELAAKLVQLKNKAKRNSNTFISGNTWKSWVTKYKSNSKYNGIKGLDKVVKDWDKLAKWADKAIPAISPIFVPKFIWNGNDNTKMNNAD